MQPFNSGYSEQHVLKNTAYFPGVRLSRHGSAAPCADANADPSRHAQRPCSGCAIVAKRHRVGLPPVIFLLDAIVVRY